VRHRHRIVVLLAATAAVAIGGSAFAQAPAAPPAQSPTPKPIAPPAGLEPSTTVSNVVVTASRVNLLGQAETASQGSVTQKEVELRPIYRPGQLLETTPGLVVTAHSGEGKANQYLVRGFNLDHGTDIANFIDDMPINRPSNAHGQGYSDVNFFIPEVAAGLDFTKGPYYASVGDFGAVASTHVKLANEIPNQIAIEGGTLGRYDVFGGGTARFGDDDHDRLLAGQAVPNKAHRAGEERVHAAVEQGFVLIAGMGPDQDGALSHSHRLGRVRGSRNPNTPWRISSHRTR